MDWQSTELCRALSALGVQGYDLASRSVGTLQQLRCSAFPDGPTEAVQHLQGGGAGHAQGWALPAQHRHALWHAQL